MKTKGNYRNSQTFVNSPKPKQNRYKESLSFGSKTQTNPKSAKQEEEESRVID